MRKITTPLLLLSSAILFIGLAAFYAKGRIFPAPVPQPQTYVETRRADQRGSSTVEIELPAEVNLEIPFILQAPHHNWELPYKQFCEEASVLMVAAYIAGQPVTGADDADRKLLAVQKFEMERFGFYEDTNVEETEIILKEYFRLPEVEVISDPTASSIRSYLARGRAVIIPAAGRMLDNPYYQSPGPLYHMLVIKGYTKNGDFITNDPGTRRGADYVYRQEIIMEAIHDWNGGEVDTSRKAIIVVG